jgi:hypothetical protein
MIRKVVILTAALAAVAAAAASAQPVAAWNSGYNGWWPGGFGYPPVTVQANTKQCSVTAYGPTFHKPAGSGGAWTQFYGAGASCESGVGVKTLTVSSQVLGQDGHTWYTITGSTVSYGPSTNNPVRISQMRAAYLGHVYRTVATATMVAPNGHAGCSLNNTCSPKLVVKAVSRPLAP